MLQFTVRDRNRMALQSDLLGAAALGVPNILCLHGDDVKKGDQPETKPVYDVDSRELMRTARRLRDEGSFPSGRVVDPRRRAAGGTERRRSCNFERNDAAAAVERRVRAPARRIVAVIRGDR